MTKYTRLQSETKLPEYKDYMNFVSAYKHKKEVTDCDNTNTVKVFSDKKIEIPCDSNSLVMEKPKNGTAVNSLKPILNEKTVNNTKSPQRITKRTELYIVLNQDETDRGKKTEVSFDNIKKNMKLNNGTGTIAARKKIFEQKNENNESKSKSIDNSEKSYNKPFLDKINDIYHENSKLMKSIKSENSIRQEQDCCNIKTLEINPNSINIKSEISKDNSAVDKHENDLDIKSKNIIVVGTPPIPPPMPTLLTKSSTISEKTIEPKQEKRAQLSIDMNKVPRAIKSSSLNRTNTDTLVRKLAYGAMLDMYGACHNKANSYVATLPRNGVKKENELQKIIDNIAAQGGLGKLSGRSNPKQDN